MCVRLRNSVANALRDTLADALKNSIAETLIRAEQALGAGLC
jgi:hypothetical protein